MLLSRLTIIDLAISISLAVARAAFAQATQSIGALPGEAGVLVSTKQVIRPAGRSVEFRGRPVDLVVSPDGKTVYVKSGHELLAIDVNAWTIRQTLTLPEKHAA